VYSNGGTETKNDAADLAARIRTVAATRAQFPQRCPAARRVGGRPPKPANRDHARRVFTRRERANLHAHTGRAKVAGAASSYRTPHWVGPPTNVFAGRANARRSAYRCGSGEIDHASGSSRGTGWKLTFPMPSVETLVLHNLHSGGHSTGVRKSACLGPFPNRSPGA
jgi:hypothetical protein